VGKVFTALKKAGLSSSDQRNRDREATNSIECSPESLSPEMASTVDPVLQEKKASTRAPSFSLERSEWDERLTRATAVSGTVAESFRALRTRILHPESGKKIRSILVTSAVPGEGKSFVCANLGVSFAQGMDHRGLLLNCDLRRPALEKMFGLPNERGLADFLREGTHVEKYLADVGVDKLQILPAGHPPVNPAELLGSETMRKLVVDLVDQDEHRFLLLDSPPMHSAAETSILINYVDAVVLVVRYGRSRREHIRSLVDQIGKEKIIGVVFNAYESSPLEEKLFGAYESQYGYYYEEE